MATTTVDRVRPGAARTSVRGRWIDEWDPEDPAFWERSGRRIARRNLLWSMFAEHVGFCVWVLWTVVVLNLANVGIVLSVSELFVLTLVPNLVGFVAMHDARTNRLTSGTFDPYSRQPAYKSGAVQIRRAKGQHR